jgi:hypothetical protein
LDGFFSIRLNAGCNTAGIFMDDLRKTSVPDGALRIEIDDPQSRRLEKPAGVIRGWFASQNMTIPEAFHFQLAGITLPHRVESREDVEEVLTGHTIVGFAIPYDLSDYLLYLQDNCLSVRLMLSGYDPYLLRFRIADRALAICLASAGGV